MSYVIKGGLQAYAFLFNLKLFTMSTNIFAALLSPSLHNDMASYVGSHTHFAMIAQYK